MVSTACRCKLFSFPRISPSAVPTCLPLCRNSRMLLHTISCLSALRARQRKLLHATWAVILLCWRPEGRIEIKGLVRSFAGHDSCFLTRGTMLVLVAPCQKQPLAPASPPKRDLTERRPNHFLPTCPTPHQHFLGIPIVHLDAPSRI
jgi:hypothetical protein